MMDRYEIGCEMCGLLFHVERKAQAFEAAKEQMDYHDRCGRITIYDRLAHRGKPQLFAPNGFIMGWRPMEGSGFWATSTGPAQAPFLSALTPQRRASMPKES